MKKSKILLSVLTVLLVVLLSACASSNNGANGNSDKGGIDTGNGSAATNGATPENVTLRFSWWGNDPRHQATLKAIEKYQELFPHIKIEAEYMGYDGYTKKLSTQFAGNAAPDLFQYGNAFNDQLGDFVYDIKEAKQIDLSTFPESALKDAIWKDKLTYLASGLNASSIIYNKVFFEKHGIPADTDWTWNTILEVGTKVHQTDPQDYLLTADSDVIEMLILHAIVTQKTGNEWASPDYALGFTEQDLAEAYTFLVSLYDNGVLEPFGDSTAFVGKMEQNPKWVQGHIGFVLDFIAALDKYNQSLNGGEVAVARYPRLSDGKQDANPLNAGTGFAINNASKHKDEAAKFLNWMVNDPEAAVILTTQRGIPASSTALDALNASGLINPEIAKAVDFAKNSNSLPISAIGDNTNLKVVHIDTIQKVIYGKLTPEEGAKEAHAAMTEKLKEMQQSAQ